MSKSTARKVTYSLPVYLLSEMETAFRKGAAPSFSTSIARQFENSSRPCGPPISFC